MFRTGKFFARAFCGMLLFSATTAVRAQTPEPFKFSRLAGIANDGRVAFTHQDDIERRAIALTSGAGGVGQFFLPRDGRTIYYAVGGGGAGGGGRGATAGTPEVCIP